LTSAQEIVSIDVLENIGPAHESSFCTMNSNGNYVIVYTSFGSIHHFYKIIERNEEGQIIRAKDLKFRPPQGLPKISAIKEKDSFYVITYDFGAVMVLDSLLNPINIMQNGAFVDAQLASNNDLYIGLNQKLKIWKEYSGVYEITKRTFAGGVSCVDSSAIPKWELLIGSIVDSLVIDTSNNDTIVHYQGNVHYNNPGQFTLGNYIVEGDTIYGFGDVFLDSILFRINFKLETSGNNLLYKIYKTNSELAGIHHRAVRNSRNFVQGNNFTFASGMSSTIYKGASVYSFDRNLIPQFQLDINQRFIGATLEDEGLNVLLTDDSLITQLNFDVNGDLAFYNSLSIVNETFIPTSGYFDSQLFAFFGRVKIDDFSYRNLMSLGKNQLEKCGFENIESNLEIKAIQFKDTVIDIQIPSLFSFDTLDYNSHIPLPFEQWTSDMTILDSVMCELKSAPIDTIFGVNVYPNPASEFLNITSEHEIGSINIYNAQGKLVYDGSDKEIYVANWSSGLYLVVLELNGSVYRRRVIVI
jgi:hypothetical protein